MSTQMEIISAINAGLENQEMRVAKKPCGTRTHWKTYFTHSTVTASPKHPTSHTSVELDDVATLKLGHPDLDINHSSNNPNCKSQWTMTS